MITPFSKARPMRQVGNQYDVMRIRRDLTRDITCDLGEKHEANFYERKFLTVVRVEKEWIHALHYTSSGWGEVLYATDYQGREYRSAPGWDWSAGATWTRRTDDTVWNRSPLYLSTINYDLTGKRIR